MKTVVVYKEVAKWLANIGMPVSKHYLRLRLESHPDYPSLAAIQETLAELKIDTRVCQATAESLQDYVQPILAKQNGEMNITCIIPGVDTGQDATGIINKYRGWKVILAERKMNYGNEDHDRYYRREQLSRIYTIILLTVLQSLLAVFALLSRSVAAVFLFSNLAGLYFCGFAVSSEAGLKSKVTFPGDYSEKSGIKERKLNLKLRDFINMADAGIVYFSASVIILLLNLLLPSKIDIQFYNLLSAVIALYLLYYVVYKWEKVRKWPMQSVATAVVLLLSGGAGLIQMKMSVLLNKEMLNPGLVFLVLLLFLFPAWLLIKNLNQQYLESNEININVLKENRKAACLLGKLTM